MNYIVTGLCQLDARHVVMQYQTAGPISVVGQLREHGGLLLG